MPPKKASHASPASQRGGGRLVAPSPARSTRSARSHKGDDHDNESENGHGSFKVPSSRNGRANGLSLKDTSVNIAAAFNAAQAGYLPTPNTSAYSRPQSRNDASGSRRALSPAEQLADSARALSPVRYFLHPTDNNDSGEFNSFSSLVNPSSNNTSYDYQQEEEYVKAKMRNENGHNRRTSESRRKKAMDGDMPYRPAEDDWAQVSGESDAEGEGIVSGGALAGRAATRGKTKEKGEGYLGAGLGIQPRRRRNKGDLTNSDEEDGTDEIDVHHSPVPSYHGRNGFSRSPTPAQQFIRAISPRISPGPRPIAVRRRQPSSLRIIVTNVLHGIVDALRFVTDLLVGALKTLVLKPIEIVSGSSKQAARRLKQNWWRLLGAMIALSLLIRLLNRSPAHMNGPSLSDSSYLTLNDRLDHLERAISSIAGSPHAVPSHSSTLGDLEAEKLLDRISLIEASLAKSPTGAKVASDSASKADLKKLRSDLQDVSSKVNAHDKSIAAAAQSGLSATQRLERDLRLVEKRVDQVEDQVRAALDDGRLRSAIERILPDWMPIKMSRGGRIDVEPVFWTEMKKVLAGKDDVDKAVQAGLAGIPTDRVSFKEMEQWGERLFATKAANGLIITRDQFLQAMGNELEDLKTRIDQDRQQANSNGKPSSTVIKTHKGDDITSMLQELVDAAILKYSKDTLATPDYALFTAGARVVPSITSDTLLLKSAPRLGKWLAGMKDIEGRSPATALHPDNSVGSCWPFQGSQGQLGILLSRRIVISDITIEHAAKELSPDITTAPKSIEVWGLVETEENKAKVSEYLSSSTQHTSPSSVPPSSNHLLLASFQYDPQAENPIQTFPVPPAILEMAIDMGIIVVKVGSNWGGDLTCLYRVRVHGEMLGEADTE